VKAALADQFRADRRRPCSHPSPAGNPSADRSAAGWREAAPVRRGPGRGHLRPAGIGRRRLGRLRNGGTGTRRIWREYPRHAGHGDHRPRCQRRWNGGLADHLDRVGRRHRRGRRRHPAGPGAGRPAGLPGNHRLMRLARPIHRPRTRIPARVRARGPGRPNSMRRRVQQPRIRRPGTRYRGHDGADAGRPTASRTLAPRPRQDIAVRRTAKRPMTRALMRSCRCFPS